jgi:hypothetical protein
MLKNGEAVCHSQKYEFPIIYKVCRLPSAAGQSHSRTCVKFDTLFVCAFFVVHGVVFVRLGFLAALKPFSNVRLTSISSKLCTNLSGAVVLIFRWRQLKAKDIENKEGCGSVRFSFALSFSSLHR